MDAQALAPDRLAGLALAVHAVDPIGTGALWIRGRAGPLRDRILTMLRRATPTARKIGIDISDEALFGGIDISQSLSRSALVRMPGLLERTDALLVSSAERCPARLAAHLSGATDRGRHSLVYLDEGATEDERPPETLLERAGLFLSLDGWRETAEFTLPASEAAILNAKGACGDVILTEDQARDLVSAATSLGIGSLRAPLYAIAVARALAAIFGRSNANADDVQHAAALVFGHKAMVLPDELSAPPPEEPESAAEERPEQSEDTGQEDRLPAEMLLDAVRSALTGEVLSLLKTNQARMRNASGAGAGSRIQSNRRGRPLPPRAGHPDTQHRVDLAATLRTAAPWQPMRRAARGEMDRLIVEVSDLRLKRYEETSDRVLIFAVDASGSQALSRLAEAKGAVEILLSEAYARRDHVALIGFRGDGAEMLLPPTRSLVQTKRRLSALPGGGGTPLAAGLSMASETAGRARAEGMTPSIILLTDGRANIALDGRADRAAAAEDAEKVCRSIAAQGIDCLILDTGMRPSRQLEALSPILNGAYIALPRADAQRLSAAVTTALGE